MGVVSRRARELSRMRDRHGPTAAAIVAFLVVAAAGAALFTALRRAEQTRVRAATRAVAELAAAELGERIEFRLETLERLAARVDALGIDEALWTIEATLYRRHLEFLEALAVVDRAGRALASDPPSSWQRELASHRPSYLRAIERGERQVVVDPAAGAVILVAPARDHAVVGAWDLAGLIGYMLKNLGPGHRIEVADAAGLSLAGVGPAAAGSAGATADLDVGGSTWAVTARPGAREIAEIETILPWTVLLGALSFAAAAAALARARGEARRRARDAEAALAMAEAARREREEAHAELGRYAVELERSNRELEQFAYVASHDLQEPLRTVASFVTLLQRRYAGRLDADADEFIGFAVEGSVRMQRLINDLLAYSRVGTRRRPHVAVPLAGAVDRALAALGARIDESGARLEIDRLPTVLGDEEQLVQLFQNLIANALKFHGDSPPRIRVSASALSDGAVEVSVADQGIGIDPAYHERIFQLFQRLHGREEFEGTGVGLALVRRIVDGHGGRIRVVSEPGRGADFRFTLPLAETKP